MRHTLIIDLTDQQESGWAHYMALVNAERVARGEQPFATLDEFMVHGPVNPAVLGDDYYTQAVERQAQDIKPFLVAITEKTLTDPATKDRIAAAEDLDVKDAVVVDPGLVAAAPVEP